MIAAWDGFHEARQVSYRVIGKAGVPFELTAISESLF